MRGSGYSIEPACSADAAPGALCPTLSHLSAVGGPAKMRADWAFVSPVSAVSPNLKTNRDGIAEWRRQRRALVGAFSPTLRQVGRVQHIQAFMVRQPERDTGGTAETHIVASRPRVPRRSHQLIADIGERFMDSIVRRCPRPTRAIHDTSAQKKSHPSAAFH
jgi:hypothetical protein